MPGEGCLVAPWDKNIQVSRRVALCYHVCQNNPVTTMAFNPRHDLDDVIADPFLERSGDRLRVSRQILGGCFHFESTSAALMRLVEAAYGGLPQHRFPMAVGEFQIELRLSPRQDSSRSAEPPLVQMQSGSGLFCGVMDACNYVVVAPEQRRALVVVSEDMLSRVYYARYELIEFAVFTLATRGQGLVPLHGACVGRGGRGVLLLGASGAGKSTLALHSLLQGLDFLAEDAVFVQPQCLLATGVANYLHVKADALHFIEDAAVRGWISEAPVIRRRSGVEKFEADLRHGPGKLAAAPLTLVGAVFVSSQSADDAEMLLSLVAPGEVASRLATDQPYAAGQPGWAQFEQELMRRGVHELRRGRHPRESAEALQQLLG